MPVITAMRPRRGGHGRVTLELDGAPWRVASYEAVAETGVEVGWDLDATAMRELERRLDERAAFESALRILALRARTAEDLTRRLRARGVAEPLVLAAVARCHELALIDEAAVLRARAETLRARGAGPRRAARELAALGGDTEAVREAVDAVFPPAEAAALALAAARRLSGDGAGGGDDGAGARLRARLLRLGHAPQDVHAAVTAVLGAATADAETGAEDPRRARRAGPPPPAPARPAPAEAVLATALTARYGAAATDPRVARRAWAWAARRGMTPEAFRRWLQCLGEEGTP